MLNYSFSITVYPTLWPTACPSIGGGRAGGLYMDKSPDYYGDEVYRQIRNT